MKVLFVFSIGKLSGGAAGVWLNLLDTLPARGVEPYVVIPADEDGTLTHELAERDIVWTEAFFAWWVTSDPNPRSLSHRVRRRGAKIVNRSAGKAIGAFIDQEGIELVYICDGTITAGLEEAKQRGIPVVWHVHQFISDAVSGTSYIDPEAHVGSTLARADAIITVSESIKTYLRSRFPMCRNVHAIYNGISCARVYDKEGIFEGEQVIFTCAGRFDDNKRQGDALNAFMQIAPEFPEARLRFVGAGDGRTIARLQHLASTSPVADQIEFSGFVKDMQQVWQHTDVALNCSYSEGCSMVVGEAMSSGCLLLCSTAEGNVEIVDGKYGLLYERGKIDALAERMRWVLEHREQAQAIAALGKQRAARIFNLDRQADAIYRVFTKVLS